MTSHANERYSGGLLKIYMDNCGKKRLSDHISAQPIISGQQQWPGQALWLVTVLVAVLETWAMWPSGFG